MKEKIMLNLLTAQDPLGGETVIVNIQVKPDNKQRNQRTTLVTVGISGQVPIMASGPFGQLNELINQAWRSFGEDATAAPLTIQPKSNQDKTKPNKNSILSLF